MRRVEYLRCIANLFSFKSIYDESGNEYVLFADSILDSIEYISDHTAFEAYENHVHLLEKVKEQDFPQCIEIAHKLGYALLSALHNSYPDKKFVAFASIKKNDSLTIRFHQKWENEDPYYDPEDFTSDFEKVIMMEL